MPPKQNLERISWEFRFGARPDSLGSAKVLVKMG